VSTVPGRIGRFEILAELGRGAMGVVYEARDPALERTVALKIIHPDLAPAGEERDTYEQRFLIEAKAAARLSHPGLVVVHDVGRDEETGRPFIALERLPGETLADALRRGERFPWRQALEIGRQLAEALHHAHVNGVVHRDVKPANVMLLPSGQAKLMDFGVARIDASHITGDQALGTPLYMCPEQAMSQPVDARSDIFSLGAVLYYALTGHHAFAADSVGATILRVMNEDPLPPSFVNPEVPHEVDDLISRCLAKAPASRYFDAKVLADDIVDFLEGRPARRRRAPTAPAPPPPTAEATSAGVALPGAGQTTMTVAPTAAAPLLARGPLVIGALAVALVLTLAALWREPARPFLARRFGAVPLSPALPSPAPPSAFPPPPTAMSAPAAAATAVASETRPAAKPARVVIDFRHPLETGSLRIYMDDEPVLGRRVRGTVTRNLLAVKLRSGVFTQVLDVDPGRHSFRVEVVWDENRREASIPGRVLSGETYRLEIRLGRLDKDLSLRWTR
jgi:serine/threonine-protein kinase